MIPLLLIGLALVAFVMGYRFYGKFLTMEVFRLLHNAPTPATHRHDGMEFERSPLGVLIAHHVAANTGLVTIIGIGIAVSWGWVPAFLWVVIGALIAGGTLALGSLWLSLRFRGDTLPGVAREFLGWSGAAPLYALALLLLLALAALAVLMIGRLLDTQSSAVWAFGALALAAAAIRRGWDAPSPRARLLYFLAAAGWLGGGLAIGQWFPVVLSGGWTISLGNDRIITLGGELFWGLVAVAFAAFSLKMPVAHTARARGQLAGALLAVTLVGIIAGLVIAGPELSAPQFARDPALPSAFLLLVLVVTGGAVAGLGALTITGPTVRQLNRLREARVVAYGGSLADALVGVVVVLLCGVSLAGADAWSTVYAGWPDSVPLFRWLDLFVVRGARFIAVLGVPLAWAHGLVALTLAALVACGLESVLRTTGYIGEELAGAVRWSALADKTTRDRGLVAALIVLVIAFAQLSVSVDHWLAVGVIGQGFVVGAFAIILLALMRIGRPVLLVAIPLAVVGAGLMLGTVAVLVDWWQHGRWLLFTVGTIATGLTAWVAASATRAALQLLQRRHAALPIHSTNLYSRYAPPPEN